MLKRTKSKLAVEEMPTRVSDTESADLALMVEHIMAVLGRHEADPNEGVLSLLTAFMQAADRVLEYSAPEDTEHNRATLLGLIDQAKRFVGSWPHRTPQNWHVH